MRRAEEQEEGRTVTAIMNNEAIIRDRYRDRYWTIRIRRHLILLLVAGASTLIAYIATPPPDIRHRLSMATAYAALLFLAASLCLGPLNVLRGRPNPISFDLRRDVGIWAGILAVVHTAIGLTVHLRGRMWMYFLKSLDPLKIQDTQFGLANYLGLAAALLFVLLLAISNDYSLRHLSSRRWKSLQRWAYVAGVLTILHGLFYQIVEARPRAWVVVYWAVVAIACGFQGAGQLYRRKGLSRDRSC